MSPLGDPYRLLLALYAGRGDLAAVEDRTRNGPLEQRALMAYGTGAWHAIEGRKGEALRRYRRVVADFPPSTLGALSAAAELRRRAVGTSETRRLR